MKKNKKEKGFTLVELLVVITIMGIMGTLLVTNYTKYIDKSKQVVVDEQLSEIVKTFEVAILSNEVVNSKTITSYDDIKGANTNLKDTYEALTGNKLPDSSTLTMDTSSITYSNNGKTASYAYKD